MANKWTVSYQNREGRQVFCGVTLNGVPIRATSLAVSQVYKDDAAIRISLEALIYDPDKIEFIKEDQPDSKTDSELLKENERLKKIIEDQPSLY